MSDRVELRNTHPNNPRSQPKCMLTTRSAYRNSIVFAGMHATMTRMRSSTC